MQASSMFFFIHHGAVGQGCSLFMRCRNILPGGCGAGVQPIYACRNILPKDCGAGVQPVYAV